VIAALNVAGTYFPGNYGMYLRVREYGAGYGVIPVLLFDAIGIAAIVWKIGGGSYGKCN
jgi:hypothetical protein